MIRIWDRLPAVIRAILAGYFVTAVGSLANFFIFANLKFLPQVPWLLPATFAWLWLFWKYANGAGWPRSTREMRQTDLRAKSLPRRVWGWALFAGGMGLMSTLGIGFLTPRLADIPASAFKIPIDFSVYPWWMTLSILLAISLTAGVAEESGYRGFMLSPIQRRHGWIAAALITGFVFFLDHHFSHAYATFAFLPFFLSVSAIHTLLVHRTGSIRPSIVLHAALDFVVIPIQYGLIVKVPITSVLKTGVDRSFVIEGIATLIFGFAAIPAFQKLAGVVRVQQVADVDRPRNLAKSVTVE